MSPVWVSVGSNIDPVRHIRSAARALAARFGPVRLSRVYETAPVGFEGAAFLNLVIGFATDESAEAVLKALRAIEDAEGRDRSGPAFGPRTLDLDLLVYGELNGEVSGKPLPHPDILKYPFVLGPLAELAPHQRHPALGKSYGELWRQMRAREGVELKPVAFELE
jgi:2-amino-4-hydroxy-6-hydroxymethyldihydropteridine diphosphokinase